MCLKSARLLGGRALRPLALCPLALWLCAAWPASATARETLDPVAALSSTAAPSSTPTPKAEAMWLGKAHNLDKLPDTMPLSTRTTLAEWRSFLEGKGYRAWVAKDGRVVLLMPQRSKGDKRMELVERTLVAFDAVLPVPASRLESAAVPEVSAPAAPAAPAAPEGSKEAGNGEGMARVTPQIETPPEDDLPPGAVRAADGSWTYTWKEDGAAPDTETAVILELGKREDQRAVIAHLEKLHPYLGAFETGNLAGFSLERPLVAAWLANEPENEEWNPDAELVHRTATLLFLRRFGSQPFWLQTGFAWHLEIAIVGGIWCFPYRAEFIFAVEHTAWPANLESMFEKRAKQPFGLGEVAHWKRGTFDRSSATKSWGTAAWLATQRPAEFSAALEALRIHRDTNNRINLENGEWRRIPGWEVPQAVQAEVFERHFSPKIWAELTDAFRGARTGALAKTRAR